MILAYMSNEGSIKYTAPKKKVEYVSGTYKLKDMWAEECALTMAEKMQCVSCLCNFSRVVVDANRHLSSLDLFNGYEKEAFVCNTLIPATVIGTYYGVYYTVIREVIESLDPLYHVSVHTKKTLSVPGIDLEVVHRKHNALAERMVAELAVRGIKSRCNESLEFEAGVNRAMELVRSPEPGLVSFRVNIREDAVSMDEQREKLVSGLSVALSKVLIAK